jgi:hypothetical protein
VSQNRDEMSFSPSFMHGFEETIRRRPRLAKQRELTVAYARREGGLTLEFLRRLNGPFFGEPTAMSLPACARELGVPVSELQRIAKDASDWVTPRLESSSEGRANPPMRRAQLPPDTPPSV